MIPAAAAAFRSFRKLPPLKPTSNIPHRRTRNLVLCSLLRLQEAKCGSGWFGYLRFHHTPCTHSDIVRMSGKSGRSKLVRFQSSFSCWCIQLLVSHRCHCAGDNVLRALELHEEMVSQGIKTGPVTLAPLCCKMGMPSKALEHVSIPKESGIYLDRIPYGIRLAIRSQLGTLCEAVKWLHDMESQRLPPHPIQDIAMLRRCSLTYAEFNVDPDPMMHDVLATRFCRKFLWRRKTIQTK